MSEVESTTLAAAKLWRSRDWLDCLVGCAAAASMCGIRTPGETTPKRQRKRYTQEELRRR